MKLPPGLEPSDNGEVLLSAAELEELGRRLSGLIAQRDHARAWAAFHQADAKQERHRLHLLMTFGRTSPERAEQIMGEHLPEPKGLAAAANDGWIGMMADTSTPVSIRPNP